jgi:hypothetical protein
MESKSTDLLRPHDHQLLFDDYREQLRAAKTLPDESRQALAKSFLTDFAERLPERCANISIADKYGTLNVKPGNESRYASLGSRF